MTKAIVIGANGQDGSYLLELLLSKGYEVHGTIRRSSVINTERIDHLMEDEKVFGKTLFIHYGDVTDASNINALVSKIQPDEIYNLSAQSHVKVSFEMPAYTAQVDACGVLNVLEAVRNLAPHCKVYQASTSELYGGLGYNMPAAGYDENSPFHPRSPYGCAKIYGYWITKNYREAYGMFSANGILFNHESPRRGETFVTRKITKWFGRAVAAPANVPPLVLGNLDAKRDWGHAKDYVEGMYRILQAAKADDWVIATGETHSVREFVEECWKHLDNEITWEGSGANEKGYVNNKLAVVVDPKYYRPSEVPLLLGNGAKIKAMLGWEPRCKFLELVQEMMDADISKG
jgi:GDPmannose 4,6-dehydratase